VLADAVVMMADGANTVRGIDVLRQQVDLLGEVASPATLSRALGEVRATSPDLNPAPPPDRPHPAWRTAPTEATLATTGMPPTQNPHPATINHPCTSTCPRS
jgi:hypothetical protein